MLFDELFGNPIEQLQTIYDNSWKGEEHEVQNSEGEFDVIVEDN